MRQDKIPKKRQKPRTRQQIKDKKTKKTRPKRQDKKKQDK